MKTVLDYLRLHGIPWRRMEERDFHSLSPTWDGEVLTLPWGEKRDSDGESIGWVFHEISHYLFAPPTSRGLPNYGLGTDPGGGATTPVVPGASRGCCPDEDESAVCILDLVRMHEEGVTPAVIHYHSSLYNIWLLTARDYTLLEEVGYCRDRVMAALPYLQK